MTSKLRKVSQVVQARETSDGAGVRLKRSLGTPALDYWDPFLLLDEFKSDDSSDYIAGFPDHPHRGFETVTYMLAGSMEHKDHKGHTGSLAAGSVQWMTAGRGIIHSEMPKQKEGLLWGFQLWVNLPSQDKMCEPRYQEFPPQDIPAVKLANGIEVRVIAGKSHGVSGAVTGIATNPHYLDVKVPAGQRFEQPLPSEHNAFCYVFDGEGEVGQSEEGPGTTLGPGHLAVVSDGDAVAVSTASSEVRLLLLAAEPLIEPVARFGPFVMSTQEQLIQAVRDFQTGTFLE
jgi:redox-sensitive bicupin YhaK (pirin superfamily)